MVIAEITLTDILWSMFAFFILFIMIMILLQVITDLFRDHEESGIAKALWVFFLIFFTPLAILMYLIIRGPGMAQRNLAAQQKAQEQFNAYVQQTAGAGGGTAADQILKAKELLDAGAISQAEFDSIKAKALG